MFIAADEPDVMMITEVIPKAQKNPIFEIQLDIEGYELYKNFNNDDLDLGASGIRGVVIYVKSILNSKDVTTEIAQQHKDQLWIEIELIGKDKLLCGCMYRSPSNDKNISCENTRLITLSIGKAMERNPSHILVSGDFNFKEIDWENEYVRGNHQHISLFMETLQDLFLKQHVTEPTRYRNGEEPSLLDLIITNEEGMIQNLSYHPALGDSDHCCLKFDLCCYAYHHKRKVDKVPNYYKANYETIQNRLMDINWDVLLNGTLKDDYAIFVEQLDIATSGCIPNHISPRKKHNIYMTAEALRLKNKKKRLWRRYARTRSSYDHSAFVQSKNKLRNLTRNLRADYESLIANGSKNKPKTFWRYVKSKLKTRVRIPTLKKDDGSLSVSPSDKAEALNCYFSSVFGEENLANVPIISDVFTGVPLISIEFTEDMLLEKLKLLNPSKSPGPDGCHPYFLRELANELCMLLTMFFQKSLQERAAPSDWLEVWITAIHKKGAKDVLSNYRPVSLTSVICKLFESFIKESIIEHMTENSLLADEQHGFVPYRNCMTNLLTSIEDWSTAIEEGKMFDLIYMNFSKAFDSVPHVRLMSKLNALGIDGEILGWIEAFLSNRKQQVIVEGEKSM